VTARTARHLNVAFVVLKGPLTVRCQVEGLRTLHPATLTQQKALAVTWALTTSVQGPAPAGLTAELRWPHIQTQGGVE